MDKALAGQRALVTAGASGIGRAIARRFAAEGARVFVCDVDGKALAAFLAENPGSSGILADVADPAQVDRLFDAVASGLGGLDILVNNAGIAPQVQLETGSDADLDALLDINVKGPFRLLRAAFPHLKRSGSGRVVNVASLSGKRVLGLNAGYQMAKHAVVALNHAVRRAGWEHGIRSTALCPGFVNTDMVAGHEGIDMSQVTQPGDLAALCGVVVDLPNSASVAELLVNWRLEPSL